MRLRLNLPVVIGFGLFMALCVGAHAQTTGATAVSSCGTASYSAGKIYPTQQTTTGNLCTSGSGGGGGNVTITAPLGTQSLAASVAVTTGNGNDVAEGSTTDNPSTGCPNSTSAGTIVACQKAILAAVQGPVPAGTNLIGTVQPVSGTSGGLTPFTLTAAASTNATNVKASAGQLYKADLSNNSATLAYVSFYNNSGTPTCGTSIVYQMMIPANSTSGAGWVSNSDIGLAFSSGIAICVTTGIAGTGNVAATAYTISLGYK